MPPAPKTPRTFSHTSIKPVKTERTHEENQERAYVAASRRSDRSLEARIESAHRASEIHKRRTGRGFRITMEAVRDEEMYEEEDDHLPSQYRYIGNHLGLENGITSDRINAYLTTNMAMRQLAANILSQNGNPGFIQNQQSSNFTTLPYSGQNGQFNPSMQQNQQPQQAAMYRHAPYPMPGSQNTFQHSRSSSFAAPGGNQSPAMRQSTVAPATIDTRRMSAAAVSLPDGSPVQLHTPTSTQSAQSTPILSRHPSNFGQPGPSTQSQMQQPAAYDTNATTSNYMPFTTALPAEAQQMMGSALDPNNAMYSMFMAGSERLPQYDFNERAVTAPTTQPAGRQTHPTLHGLGSTLAPPAFTEQPGADSFPPSDFFNDAFGAPRSGVVTPGEMPGDDVAWGSFLDFNDISGSQSSQI